MMKAKQTYFRFSGRSERRGGRGGGQSKRERGKTGRERGESLPLHGAVDIAGSPSIIFPQRGSGWPSCSSTVVSSGLLQDSASETGRWSFPPICSPSSLLMLPCRSWVHRAMCGVDVMCHHLE